MIITADEQKALILRPGSDKINWKIDLPEGTGFSVPKGYKFSSAKKGSSCSQGESTFALSKQPFFRMVAGKGLYIFGGIAGQHMSRRYMS